MNAVAVSLNDSTDSIRGGIYLLPRAPTIKNYIYILRDTPTIPHASFVSAARALAGTAVSVPLTLMLAYVLTRRDFILRGVITKLVVVTMYVSGGLVPIFLSYRILGLMNSFWVYVLPGAISAFNVLVMRSYLAGIPYDLVESAKLDGASEYRILFTVMLPLAMPVIATIGLFVSVTQWNQWFDTMLYNSGAKNLSTLQYELKKVLDSSQGMTSDAIAVEAAASTGQEVYRVTSISLRAAMTIISTVPIVCVYPFLQKYFVKGLTLGAVKG
jgi:putative aldouronate transport system permease protein